MSATIKGKAVIWGANGITSTGVIINESTPTTRTQSIDATRDSDVFQVSDAVGEVCTEVFFNEKVVLNIDVIPIAASALATAITNCDNLTPAPGTLCTIVDAQSGMTDGANGGKYSVISSTLKRTNTGAAVISLQLRTYAANDVTSATT